MKNKLLIDIDTDRKNPGPVIILKPQGVKMPTSKEEHVDMVIMDMASLCEAVCTLIRLAEDQGIRPSADSLRICIKHITDGFADPDYKTLDNSAPKV